MISWKSLRLLLWIVAMLAMIAVGAWPRVTGQVTRASYGCTYCTIPNRGKIGRYWRRQPNPLHELQQEHAIYLQGQSKPAR